jgi:hypothetical protein
VNQRQCFPYPAQLNQKYALHCPVLSCQSCSCTMCQCCRSIGDGRCCFRYKHLQFHPALLALYILKGKGKEEEEDRRTSIKICTGTKGSFAITRQSGLWWRASESFAIDAGAEELAAVEVIPSLIFDYPICCDDWNSQLTYPRTTPKKPDALDI